MVKKQFHCPQTSEELQEIASELEVQRLLHLIFFSKVEGAECAGRGV